MTVNLMQAELGNIMYTGLSTDTKPTTNVPSGVLFFETDTFRVYVYDGTTWQLNEEAKQFDFSDRPVKAQGTTDGVQYDAEVVTVAANIDVELLLWKSEDNYPKTKGNLAYVYYNIAFQLKAGSATADLKWKLQARNKDGTWTDMCAEQTETDIDTTYVDKRIEGFLDIKTNITTAPFEMRLIFQSNEATPGIGTGHIKNTTIVNPVGEVN